ncbi:SH3 and multiple ankyrin repeat domains protein 2-like isoform X1 [Bolinopsis microptera]|uniref:SH3 and multiple ankyrin repeat domains protein 2-like isoform X1 n=2 Tax=Bolinopsis microptera TaxID=2820187 RepID=UPI003079E531
MSVNSIEPLIRSARHEEDMANEIVTKTVKLVRGPQGYGMYLREACSVDKIASFVPTETKPSTQLIIDCDKGGVAEGAGLQAGDFIIEVNNEDVRKKPHTELLLLVGSLQTEVCLKVVHVPKFKILSFEAKKFRKEKKEEQKVSDTPTGDKTGAPGGSPSARRRRIKVLPKSESEEMKPDEVFEVSAGDDPNKKKPFANVQAPVRILPTNCDASTIWEQAKAMQARRKGSNPSAEQEDDSFLPDTPPEDRDPDAIIQVCRDHPYKWDVYQTGVWVKSFGLPDVAEVFEHHDIKGEHLKYISTEDLRGIGITDEGSLTRIAKEITRLLTKYDSTGHV